MSTTLNDMARRMLRDRLGRQLTDEEQAGLDRALRHAEGGGVTAKLAVDVALNDGGQDWPEAFRRTALETYNLEAVK